MTDIIRITATEADANKRIDAFVAEQAGLSRALAQQLLAAENILLNEAVVAKSYRLQLGDVVQIDIPSPQDAAILPQNIPLDVVYEDGDVLVVNKPKGMVVHPAPGNSDGTLVNALMHHCRGSLSGIGGEIRPGIVHRIDKDTSGLLVVAKTDVAHHGLARQFAQHSIQRVYDAVVYGRFKETEGEVDAPIGRSRADRKKMAVGGMPPKRAVTTWQVVAEYPGFTHLALRLHTGRTHQIRVHMAHLGHPLAGDAVYGPKKVIKSLHGQCLHAGTLGFVHPASGEEMLFTCPLPDYFTEFLAQISHER